MKQQDSRALGCEIAIPVCVKTIKQLLQPAKSAGIGFVAAVFLCADDTRRPRLLTALRTPLQRLDGQAAKGVAKRLGTELSLFRMRLATLRRSGNVRGTGVVVGPRPLDTCAAESLLCWEPCNKTGRTKSERQYHLLNSVHEPRVRSAVLVFPDTSALHKVRTAKKRFEVRHTTWGNQVFRVIP